MPAFSSFFFFNDTATTEIYTLSLHDALPIFLDRQRAPIGSDQLHFYFVEFSIRSEEHTSELQSRLHLVCRLLLEKKKKLLESILQRTTVYAALGAASYLLVDLATPLDTCADV